MLPSRLEQDGVAEFFSELGYYLAIRHLVMARRGLTVPEAEVWLGEWSAIKDGDGKTRRWEEEIGPVPELLRLREEAEHEGDTFAAKLGPILRRGVAPRTLESAAAGYRRPASPKTKVSQAFLNAIFATERTVRRYQKESRAKNNLVKAGQLGEFLEGGFTGVKLNVTEQRVIHGIFNLLGDQARIARDGNIEISGFADLHSSMGLEKKKTPRGKMEFDGWEVGHVNRVFWELAGKPQKMVFRTETTPPGSKEPKFDVIVTRAPLFEVAYLYKDVTGKKIRLIAATASLPPDSIPPNKVVIKPNAALVAEYQRYFRLLPRDPYHEIRSLLPRGFQVKAHQIYFVSWLHRHRPGKNVIETNKQSLAEELGLDYIVKAGRWKRLAKVISSDYRLAKRLGYLLDYQENVPSRTGGFKDVLTLNPMMIIHAGSTREKSQAANNSLRRLGTKTTAFRQKVYGV